MDSSEAILQLMDLPSVNSEIGRAKRRYSSFSGWGYHDMRNEAVAALCKCYNMGYFKFDVQTEVEVSKLARRIVYNAFATLAYTWRRKSPDVIPDRAYMQSIEGTGPVFCNTLSVVGSSDFFDFHMSGLAEDTYHNAQNEFDYNDLEIKLLAYASKKGGIFEIFVKESLAPSPAVWHEFVELHKDNPRFKNCDDIPPYKLAKILNMTKLDYRIVYEEVQRFLNSH